jgi:hypothetical protein
MQSLNPPPSSIEAATEGGPYLMHPAVHYKFQPPQKFHRRYLHSALCYLDEAPRNFLKKKFTQQALPLYPNSVPEGNPTYTRIQVRATRSWSFAYQNLCMYLDT